MEEAAQRLEDSEVLWELATEADDGSSMTEVHAEIRAVSGVLEELELDALYFGEFDQNPAILSVNVGAGGVDAQDWAEMLVRMYQRYLVKLDMDVTVDEYTEGEEAGIKSATLTVRGEQAYGTLEGERGVHRLVRISPFDANSRRHTSFAGVDVVPEVIDDTETIEIREEDLRIDTYRSQGAGGQHVNKTDSAVRITHLPTNLVVQCQNQRSQHQNKARAMAILRSQLADKARREQEKQLEEIRGKQDIASWGSQIRSYVMQPYQLVKDLRTGMEMGNVQGVLNGDLDGFTQAFLRWRRAEYENRQRPLSAVGVRQDSTLGKSE